MVRPPPPFPPSLANIHRPQSPPTSVASMEQRLLPIEFLIIGGGVAGLCSAITLTTAGHDVTLFEQNSSFDEVGPFLVHLDLPQSLTFSLFSQTAGAAGCRIPPNMSKFLVRWGMEEQLKKLSTTSRTIQFARCELLTLIVLSPRFQAQTPLSLLFSQMNLGTCLESIRGTRRY